MKKLLLITLITVGISLISQAGLAQEAYVVNPTKITLRKGPGVGEKIVAMLRQDESVKVLETKRVGVVFVFWRLPGRTRRVG